MSDLIERLARDIETFRLLVKERDAETTEQQKTIEQLQSQLAEEKAKKTKFKDMATKYCGRLERAEAQLAEAKERIEQLDAECPRS